MRPSAEAEAEAEPGTTLPADDRELADWGRATPPLVPGAVSRRMGLFVVARLAARHGIRVRLRPASGAGLTALVWLPDEVVVCDGGSTDGSLEVLRRETRFPLQVIERPGSNISQGRNAAIMAASGDVIASTDAGVRLDPRWLEELVGQDVSLSHVVSGFFLPDPQTPFEAAMGATVLPTLKDIQPEEFLPSSRSVAFTKAAWQAVGGYPEWLDYGEDLVFDFTLLEKYRPFAFAPQAIVHFRPRASIGAFFKQYYLYARGDGVGGVHLAQALRRAQPQRAVGGDATGDSGE